MNDRLNLGWVDYWNLLPLKVELQRLWGQSIDFAFLTPRQVNKKLRERQLDVAVGSSICLAVYPGVDMALPIGVACESEVKSAYLGFAKADTKVIDYIKARNDALASLCYAKIAANRHDFRNLASFMCAQAESQKFKQPPHIQLSPHSFTSNSLTHVLYYLWFGSACYNRFTSYLSHGVTDPADAQVVIGNEALMESDRFAHIIDLGSVWKEITSLPFVYAVFMSTSPLSRLWQHRVSSAADLATSKRLHDPHSYLQYAGDTSKYNFDLCNYWQGIHYHLKERDFCGLYLFLNLYLLLPNIIDDSYNLRSDTIAARKIHWENIASEVRANESPSLS